MVWTKCQWLRGIFPQKRVPQALKLQKPTRHKKGYKKNTHRAMHSSNGSLFWVYNGKNNCRYATDSLSNFHGKHALLDFHLSCLLKSNFWIRNCRNVHLKLKEIKQRNYLKKQQQQQQNGIKKKQINPFKFAWISSTIWTLYVFYF